MKADEMRKGRNSRNANYAGSSETSQLDGDYKGLLVCNEVSDARRTRLRKVLEGYLPELVTARKIQITAQVSYSLPLPFRVNSTQDGTVVSQKKNTGSQAIPAVLYDLVLVDAPCSSERHLLHNPPELLLWSRARSKSNAQRQYPVAPIFLIDLTTLGMDYSPTRCDCV